MAAPRVICVDGVSKRFPLHQRIKGAGSLKGALVGALWRRAEVQTARTFGVLEGVDLEIRRGDFVGIMGPNGAGKSTLLKLISGIYRPETGRVRTRGRIASLLELGTGFHPDFSGRENALINGAILGLSVREVRDRLPEIVEFSGLGDKIEAPVRTYSTGMYVRLGFSVAVHVRPVILLVDEVLAVGDRAFQEKCLAKIRELNALGTTILFVSHDPKLIRRLATRGLLVAGGRVRETRGGSELVERYLAAEAPAAAMGRGRL